MNADGSHIGYLAGNTPHAYAAWSPDSTQIVYTRPASLSVGGPEEIFTATRERAFETRLTETPDAPEWQPSWQPLPITLPTPTPTATPTPTPTPTTPPTPTPNGPVLLTEEGTEHAVALDSVTLMRDPFPLTTTYNFSPDHLTRVILFAFNLRLQPGEDAAAVSAQAEDAQGRIFPLPVESVGALPGLDSVTQVIVKLPAEMAGAGDVRVRLKVHDLSSNQALLSLRPPASSSP